MVRLDGIKWRWGGLCIVGIDQCYARHVGIAVVNEDNFTVLTFP